MADVQLIHWPSPSLGEVLSANSSYHQRTAAPQDFQCYPFRREGSHGWRKPLEGTQSSLSSDASVCHGDVSRAPRAPVRHKQLSLALLNSGISNLMDQDGETRPYSWLLLQLSFCGSGIGEQLSWVFPPQSFLRLQSRYWPGGSHLKARLGIKDPFLAVDKGR